MPTSKIDSKCFNLTTKVDSFLSLENAMEKPLPAPQDFWRELAQSQDTVSSYIVCLIAKLISLDSVHGVKGLPEVYRDLVEMSVDHSKYKQWASKALPTTARASALKLQHAILSTILFLKEMYGYSPSIHLRHMYLRWNLARNSAADGLKKIANTFEEKVITSFSVAASRQLLHSPQHLSTAIGETDEGKTVRGLVEECCLNHRRASFGVLPPEQCKLTTYTSIIDCLSYIRLKMLVLRRPHLLNIAVHHVLSMLKNEVSHASEDYGDREVLLPLLHLFREFLTMLANVDLVEAYKVVMPFYMLPVTHAEPAKRTLDLVLLEGRVKGTTFRRKIMAEHDLGVKLKKRKYRGQLVHMMVDTSDPLSKGSVFCETFQNCQEQPDQWGLQRQVIRSVFLSVFPTFDIVELEGKLQHLSSDALRAFCLEGLELMEQGTEMGVEEDVQAALKCELNKLHKKILDHAESEEQRDSAVSCDGDIHTREENLVSFGLPLPYIPTHALDNCQYPTVLVKFRDILVKSQRKNSPQMRGTESTLASPVKEEAKVVEIQNGGSQRTFSNSSRTSMDSTGSNSMEQPGATETPAVTPSLIPNGHVVNGEAVEEGVSHDSHVTSHDPALMRTPSPRPVGTDAGNTATTLGGERSQPSAQRGSTSSDPTVGDGRQYSETLEMAGTPRQNGGCPSSTDDSVFHAGPNQDFSDTSRTSGDKASDNRERSHTDRHEQAQVRERMKASMLIRRATASGLVATPDSSTPSIYSSQFSQGSGSSMLRRYTGTMGVNSGSMRVKMRANPSANLSIRQKKVRKTSVGITSPVHNPNLKVLKIILAGNDLLVCHMAKAYTYLQLEEPNLLSGMEVQFYHIPLSQASMAHWQLPELSLATQQAGADLPEPMSEQVDTSGNDVHIGRFLAHMDSWYERNVMLTVHHTLRLLPSDTSSGPQDQRPSSPLENDTTVPPTKPMLKPSKILINTVTSFCRDASYYVRVKMFKIKMSLKSEKSHKIEHREMFMLHRMDVQRLSGKKGNRQVKTFEANVTMTELSLDNSFIRSDMMQMKDVWAVRASNIPRAGDSGVPNPEMECFELAVIKAQGEKGRFQSTKYHVSSESQYHVYDLVVETRDKPLTVMVDGDSEVLVENVIRLEVTPVYVDPSFTSNVASSWRNDLRQERQLHFPLMTYWPVDL